MLSYAIAAFVLLRLSVLLLFALKLDQSPHFAGVFFVLWLAPLLFSAAFAVRAVARAIVFRCCVA